MKRIIKFRVWDKVKKIFYYPESHGDTIALSIDGTACSGYIDGDMTTTDNQDYEYQQFTGLSDKNEKKIYEGDIIQYLWNKQISLIKFGVFYNELNEDSGNGWHSVTSYSPDYINKSDCESTNSGTASFEDGDNYIVIGNIFENSNLIK